MKRLLFDLDNTLIKWKDEYTIALQKTIEEFNIDIDYHVIDAVIEKQEKVHDMMNKEVLLNDINEETGLNLDMSFVERLFEHQKYIADIDDDVIETLEYLKDKYDIVLLTNYFIEPQIGRLKKVGIDKYFSRFIEKMERLFNKIMKNAIEIHKKRKNGQKLWKSYRKN